MVSQKAFLTKLPLGKIQNVSTEVRQVDLIKEEAI